jgi:hypothetical protein
MGVETLPFVTANPTIQYWFDIADGIFLIIFTIELGFQFIFYFFRILLDGWLLFDVIVVTLSWSFSHVRVVRAFRIFRALRLVTRVRTMKNLVTGKFFYF